MRPGSGLGAKVMLNSREEEEEDKEQVIRGSVRKGVRESERLKRSEEGREAIAAAATETAIFGFRGFWLRLRFYVLDMFWFFYL